MEVERSEFVCRPTGWFLVRAAAMLLMFGVFAVLFYIDGSTGYRKKNLTFFVHSVFKPAKDEFAKMEANGSLGPDEWRKFAAAQVVPLPSDRSVLPKGTPDPLPWPGVLLNYEKVKSEDWNRLWLAYSREQGFNSEPPEKPYDSGKIFEQWVVFWVCLSFSLCAAFFLLRTMRRSIRVDDVGVTGPGGSRIPFGDLRELDLRKWETKGLAFVRYEGGSGRGRIRIDGLTYGGFKKEAGEPAEELMRRIRARFSGEILEYVSGPGPSGDGIGSGGDSGRTDAG